tara:strand:+ start:168538 stop:169410 length:873 start_codon:yes stop_codon:yes gene_type:complete
MMKQLIILTIAILVMGALYIGYATLTFSPDPIQPLAVQEEAVVVDPEKEKSDALLSSPEVQARREQAASLIIQGIQTYEDQWAEAPVQAQFMRNTFLQMIKKGALPVYYPITVENGQPVSPELLEFASSSKTQVDPNSAIQATCGPSSTVMIGSTESDRFVCPLNNSDAARIFATGPGNDVVATGGGAALIDIGTGDNTVRAGPGITLIFVEKLDGETKIEMDCQDASMRGRALATDYPLPWTYQYRHFVIMGPQINKEALVISDNLIRDPVGGGALSMSGNCFNVLFAR